MSDSVRPHRRPPTRLLRPWDSPGKKILQPTGVGCHFPLQCMKVKSESEVAQSYPTRSDPMDHSLPDSSIHGFFQAGVLEWGAIAFSVAGHRGRKISRGEKRQGTDVSFMACLFGFCLGVSYGLFHFIFATML